MNNMARRSQRISSGLSETPNSTHKRAASNVAVPHVEAKRSKTKNATPTKSQYFNKSVGPEPNDEDEEEASEESSAEDEDASEFGNDSEESSASHGDDEDDEDDDGKESDEAPKSRKKAKPSPGTAPSPAIRTKNSTELWREGVKTGLGPGTQVVIKKPKARPAGKTPYRDEAIHPNTLVFLQDLKANNERQWLKSECFPR